MYIDIYHPTTHGTFQYLTTCYLQGDLTALKLLHYFKVAWWVEGCAIYIYPPKIDMLPEKGLFKRENRLPTRIFIWDMQVFGWVFQPNFSRKIPRFGPSEPPPKNNSDWWWFEKILSAVDLLCLLPRFLGRKILTVLDDLHSYPSCFKKWQDWISWYFRFKPRVL